MKPNTIGGHKQTAAGAASRGARSVARARALRRWKDAVRKSAATAGMLTVAALFAFPIVLTFTNSFMSEAEIAVNLFAISDDRLESADPRATEFVRLQWIPERFTLFQYAETLISKPQYLVMFWNSVFLVAPIVAGQTAVASLAGYAFALLRFRLREPLFFMYIVTMLMPFQVTLVPNFLIADKLGLLNTPMAIVGPGVFGAFGVFLLRQFMIAVPYGYIEAARVDGASHAHIFARIVLPMCRSGLTALAVLLVVDNWNMVEQPLIMLHDAHKQPLSVYLSAVREGERGIAFAASAIYMTPTLLIMLYAERSFVEGIQLSGLKG